MIIPNIITLYSYLTIIVATGKRSFENMGRFIKKSGDAISRMLRPGQESLDESKKIAQQIFANKRNLVLAIDDTTIKKAYSKIMEGAFWLFDTKLQRCLIAYKLLVAVITDGKFTVPIGACFSFGKEIYANPAKATEITILHFIKIAKSLLSDANIIIALDGAFATYELLKWAIDNIISLEVRMHANRLVEYKDKKIQIRRIKDLIPKGRQMARTITVLWKDLPLYITAVRRIDKKGRETIVYQASTYKATPNVHAMAYRDRWPIEKMFRTTKQYLGLQECFSVLIQKQFDHACAVLLAYSIAQLEMKKRRLKNPEAAIRALKKKKLLLKNSSLMAADELNDIAYA